MGKAWKQPTEVEGYLVPGNRMPDPDRLAFLEDVLRRLEVTPASKALCYPFADEKQMKLYVAYIRNQINRTRGKGSVTARSDTKGATPLLYIKRGPKW